MPQIRPRRTPNLMSLRIRQNSLLMSLWQEEVTRQRQRPKVITAVSPVSIFSSVRWWGRVGRDVSWHLLFPFLGQQEQTAQPNLQNEGGWWQCGWANYSFSPSICKMGSILIPKPCLGLFVLCPVVVGIKPRASCMIGRRSTTEPHP